MGEQSAEAESRGGRTLAGRNVEAIGAETIDAALVAGERLLRVDVVSAMGLQTFQYGNGGACFSMGVTDRRLIFVRPVAGNLLRLILQAQWKGNGYLPQHGRWAVPLVRIKRLWKWQPEFSGMPMVQFIDGASLYFQLLIGEYPRFAEAPLEMRREHFESVEAAWLATRQRAAEAPNDPENRKLKTENRQ